MEESKAKASTIAKNKYNAKAYDSLRIVVKKGRKAEIQAHAEQRGESINAFVGRAIEKQWSGTRANNRHTGQHTNGTVKSPVCLALWAVCLFQVAHKATHK